MRPDEVAKHDGTGLAALLKAGEVTPKELGRAVVTAIEALNPALNAVVEVYADAVEALPDRVLPGAFGGLPTLTKDFPIEAGRPAEFGSKLARGFMPSEDTVFWTRMKRAGLRNVARTTTSEFGVAAATESPLYGATHNPWKPGHGVSGSSGGSAAAVAAGIVPFAQGGDGGGSIRNPASFCGLVGLKPSRGRVTGAPGANAPLLGLATGFFLTRSVRDTALLLDLCHGPEAGDSYEIAPPEQAYSQSFGAPPRPVRIAVSTASWSGYPVNPEASAATLAIARQLQDLGHHVEDATPQFDYEAFLAAQIDIWGADCSAGMPAMAAACGRRLNLDDLGETVRVLYEFGKTVTGADLVSALGVYDDITRQVGRFFTGYDILLSPTAPILPEPIGTYDPNRPGLDVTTIFADMTAKETFTSIFNATGQPAISLPAGLSADGLPIGVQLASRFGREDLLLKVARQLEECAASSPGVWGFGLPQVHIANLCAETPAPIS